MRVFSCGDGIRRATLFEPQTGQLIVCNSGRLESTHWWLQLLHRKNIGSSIIPPFNKLLQQFHNKDKKPRVIMNYNVVISLIFGVLEILLLVFAWFDRCCFMVISVF